MDEAERERRADIQRRADSGRFDPKLEELRRRNNPRGEPTGHYTGRCMKCSSKNLWDDMTAYGCNDCGAIYFTG